MAIALLIVDMQNDFVEGGSLAVAGGAALAAKINEIMEDYDVVVASQDWHRDPGTHWSDNPDFKDTWPVHCAAHSRGADLVADLDTSKIEAVFLKGVSSAAYSAFEGEADNVSLKDYLEAKEVDSVHVVGIALDYCVKASAISSVEAGFETMVLLNCTVAVDPDSRMDVAADLARAGVKLTIS